VRKMQPYKKNQVEAYIRLKFESNKQCADALGITESSFSRNLDRLTLNFIARLRKIGVEIPYPDEKVSFIVKDPNEKYECFKEISELKAENYDLRKRIKELESKIKSKKNNGTDI